MATTAGAGPVIKEMAPLTFPFKTVDPFLFAGALRGCARAGRRVESFIRGADARGHTHVHARAAVRGAAARPATALLWLAVRSPMDRACVLIAAHARSLPCHQSASPLHAPAPHPHPHPHTRAQCTTATTSQRATPRCRRRGAAMARTLTGASPTACTTATASRASLSVRRGGARVGVAGACVGVAGSHAHAHAPRFLPPPFPRRPAPRANDADVRARRRV
jgi:hypothetical protein